MKPVSGEICTANPTITAKTQRIVEMAANCLNLSDDILSKLSGNDRVEGNGKDYQVGIEGTLDRIKDILVDLDVNLSNINDRL